MSRLRPSRFTPKDSLSYLSDEAHERIAEVLAKKQSQALDEPKWLNNQRPTIEQEIAEVEFLLKTHGKGNPDLQQILQSLQEMKANLDRIDAEVASVKRRAPKRAGIRIASLHDIPEDFVSLGSGFYREGHAIWELRAAEDEDGGYVLTRKREERAVDMRPQAQSRKASVQSEGISVGKTALMVSKGRIATVIVIKINEDEGTAEVMPDNELGISTECEDSYDNDIPEIDFENMISQFPTVVVPIEQLYEDPQATQPPMQMEMEQPMPMPMPEMEIQEQPTAPIEMMLDDPLDPYASERSQQLTARKAHLVKRDGKYCLVSRKTPSKVLRWYGKTKPSDETVAKDERRVQFFKNKG